MKYILFVFVGLLFLGACQQRHSTAEKTPERTPPVDSTVTSTIDTVALIGDYVLSTPFFQERPQQATQHALTDFFAQLQDSSQTTHILYYGDSQIEGDRITSYIRTHLQEVWGGKGVGFLDFDDIADNINVVRRRSGNWRRDTFFNKPRKDGRYGIGGTTSTYTGDSAWVNFQLRNHFYYDQVYLLYQQPHNMACTLTCYDLSNGEVLSRLVLPPSQSPTKKILFNTPLTRRFQLVFEGPSPLLLGLWVDGQEQLQLDSFGMRGHAGYGLLTIQDDWLAEQATLLGTGLVVLHYGANEVPYIRTEAQLENFEKRHQQLIDKIKANIPQASILIVSISEMGNFRTGLPYTNLSQIRDIQQKLAKKNSCAFWDVLGMIQDSTRTTSWREEGLIAFDGHFTPKGHQKVGKTLADALLQASKNYQHIENIKKNPQKYISP
ncbi:MAG: GDSL-type esterase/lipase family protein [Thermonemataceae bacterium]